MNAVKVSFEKQLQNERTLKIQVCLGTHVGLESLEYFFYAFTHLNISFFHRHQLYHIIISHKLVLNSGQKYKNLSRSNIDIPAGVSVCLCIAAKFKGVCKAVYSCSIVLRLSTSWRR